MSNMSIQDIKPDQRISFDVYPSNILGNNFKDVKVLGFYSAFIAARFTDIYSLHANVYPQLPVGSVDDDATSYSYVEIQHRSGETTIIGTPYIKEDTIVISGSRRYTLTFENITEQDYNHIKLALASIDKTPSTVNVS